MLSFIQDYVVQPVATATMNYVVSPLVSWGRGQIIAATTKGASSALTKKVITPMLGENGQGPAFNNEIVQEAPQSISDKAKSFVKGVASENATDIGLKVVGLVSPVPKPLVYMAPRAVKLAVTTSPAKEVLFGALSHGFGRAVQDTIDSYLPQAAPYAGYVGYGVASQAAHLGLEKLDKIRPF